MRIAAAALAGAALLVALGAATAGFAAPACRRGDMAWRGVSSTTVSSDTMASTRIARPPFRLVAIVRDAPTGHAIDADDKLGSLWITRPHGPARCLRRVLKTRFDQRPEHNLATLGQLVFSPDGRTLYFAADGWATSAAIHAVNVASGAERYVTAGSDLRVISAGPYRGDLLLARHTPRPDEEAGYFFPRFVVRPSDGRALVRIAGTYGEGDDSVVSRWLLAHGAGAR